MNQVICVFKMTTGNAAEPCCGVSGHVLAAAHWRRCCRGSTNLDDIVVKFPALEAADHINSAISQLGWTLTKISFEPEAADPVQPLIDLFKEDNDDAI